MIDTDPGKISRIIIALAEAVPIGGILSYHTVSTAIGRDVRDCRWLLYAALRVCKKDSNLVFANERDVGYRRIPGTELKKIAASGKRSGRLKFRRTNETITLGMIGANDLSPADYRHLLREQAHLGLLEQISQDKYLPPLPRNATTPPDPAQVARNFLAAIGVTKPAP
jgi:hypothetical protein